MRRHHDYRGLAPDDRGAAVAMGNFDGVHLGHQSVLALAHAAAAELRRALRRGHLRAASARLLRARRAALPADDRRRAGAAARRSSGSSGSTNCRSTPRSPGSRPRPSSRRAGRAGSACAMWSSARTSASARAAAGDATCCAALGAAARLRGHRRAAGLRRAGRLFLDGDPRRAGRGPAGRGRAHPRPLAPDRGPGAAWRQARARARLPDRQSLRSTGCTCRASASTRCWWTCSTARTPGRYRGVASIGVRPTFGGTAPNLEVYLLDFDGDLYGARAVGGAGRLPAAGAGVRRIPAAGGADAAPTVEDARGAAGRSA